MSAKINVLDIEIDNCTAKEAMKKAVEYLATEPANMIEMVTVDAIMQLDEMTEMRKEFSQFDLVLAGDRMILEAAEVTDRKYLQETENHVFLKMFLRYLHKNHKRIYLLVESEEDGQNFYDYLERHYGGVQIVGMAKVSAQNRADDMLVNAINGGEIDCVLSALAAPLQEEFIVRNRNLLNAGLWLGLGCEMLPVRRAGFGRGRISQFLVKMIFKKEMEKRKNRT
ncbi:WecB/TagA/CpsF family glycosyltransferase [Lachnospiraceae bacterium KGMB03038]|nr:WecB/TagA/CpsF family glycosyltransferase [Lachnospiraceae bacterium KGMB03038]